MAAAVDATSPVIGLIRLNSLVRSPAVAAIDLSPRLRIVMCHNKMDIAPQALSQNVAPYNIYDQKRASANGWERSRMDPRKIIDEERMSGFQWSVVAIMVGLLALDGFDVLSISFASPGIAADWGIDRAELGIVLSMELVGMAIGSVLIGRIADNVGRRATILGCLTIMAAGMFAAATSPDITMLCIWRVLTGLGLGGMLAATNAATAEVANNRFRSLCVILMAAGYPLGNIIGGSVAAALLTAYDWRSVFIFGGVASLLFIPIVWFYAPESIAFHMHRRSADSLDKINATLRRMGHPEIGEMPAESSEERAVRSDGKTLMAPAFRMQTILLTLVYFMHIMTFYFILKWIPKIVADMGHEPSAAAGVLVSASVGGLIGSGLLGLATLRANVFWLTIGAMLLSCGLVIGFGRSPTDIASLSLIVALAGCATNAGIVGLYAIIALAFPTSLRATATGAVIGFGRGGSALAPVLAGFLFAAGYMLDTVALTMALGSMLAAFILIYVRRIARDF
ncbi:MFS transporter [Pelagerythrobacter marensis]|uniref:MFS transporter n=1 Tax=Pelagerythrobacter marensis TaxID=543877 RepID=A0ABZ2DAW1_9SPHN